MRDAQTIQQKIADLRLEGEELINTAKAENRDLTKPEGRRFDEIMSKVDEETPHLARAKRIEMQIVTDTARRSGLPVDDEGIKATREFALKKSDDPWKWFKNTAKIANQERELIPAVEDGELTIGRVIASYMQSYVDPEALRRQPESIRNALSVGVDTAGGFSVPSILMPELIQHLRTKSRALQAGASVVQLDQSGKTNWAKLTADAQWAFGAELSAPNAGEPTFGNVPFDAKRASVQFDVSQELIEDSINLETAVSETLVEGAASIVDEGALVGDGTSATQQGTRSLEKGSG